MMVIDASALLAYLLDEPGSDAVVAALGDGAVMSSLNVAEVLSKLTDAGASVDEAWPAIEALGIEFVALGTPEALAIARIRPATRDSGLSIADRACLALAAERAVPAQTADRTWTRVATGAEVRLIR
jgi:PIN domain nuclease of toxin-antitoxin system